MPHASRQFDTCQTPLGWLEPDFADHDQLRKGDVLVVWKLDRLSRSLRDVLTIMERLSDSEAGFRSLTEAIDTTTPAGRMMMPMVGAFAEFERAMLPERTKAGLDSARREGRIGGRRPKLSPQQQAEIRRMVYRGDKDRCRCGSAIQNPPGHRLAAPREAASPTRQEDQACQNNVDGFTPNNSESDGDASGFPAPFAGNRRAVDPKRRFLMTKMFIVMVAMAAAAVGDVAGTLGR